MALSARSLDGLHEFKQSLLSMAGEPERYATTNGTPHAEAAERSQALAEDFGLDKPKEISNEESPAQPSN